MKLLATSLLAAVALAAPRPQDMDLDAVDALPDVVSIDQSVPTTVPVVPLAAVTAAVAQDATTDPIPGAVGDTSVQKRAASCGSTVTGTDTYGVDGSTYNNFMADPKPASIASAASTPSGYINTFTATNKATQQSKFLLKTVNFATYDTQSCANLCGAYGNDANGNALCQGFNIYFSRDPSVSSTGAGPGCDTGPGTVFIRCVLYGAKVDVDTDKNAGQYRGYNNLFRTAYAGSNGYMKAPKWYIPGYSGPEDLGDSTINAPLDCNGVNTYMGMKTYSDMTTFTPQVCATACDATNAYVARHPPTDGSPARYCNFFDASLVDVNDEPQGMYCAFYTTYWDPSYATNKVQYRGDDKYTKSYSFTYYRGTSKVLPPSGSQCSSGTVA